MARLKYHQRTFDLAGLAPLVSEPNRRGLESAATAASVELPAAVIEWLMVENSIPLLRRAGRGDETLFLKEIAVSLTALAGERRPRLTFLRESQGGCSWAIDLGENPDPPVYVRLRDEEGCDCWRTTAERFSDFIWGWIWDNPRGGLTARAQLSFSLKQIRRLTAGTEELPTSRAWPTHKTFRCQVGAGRLRIHYEPSGWTEVVLWSTDLKRLGSLIEHATGAGIPRQAFFSNDTAASRLLENATRRSP